MEVDHVGAKSVGVLMNGDIFNSPKRRQLAEFAGIDNILDGVVVDRERGQVTRGRLVGPLARIDIGCGLSLLAVITRGQPRT